MANRKSKLWQLSGKDITITKRDIETANITKDNLVNYIFTVQKDQITYRAIMQLFGDFDGKSLANTYDLLEVPVGTFTYFIDKVTKHLLTVLK